MKVLIIVLFLSSTAYAQNCNYNVNTGNFTATLLPQAQVLPQEFTLSRPTNSSQSNCQTYHAYFGTGQANNYQRRAYAGSHSLTYNLYQAVTMGATLKDFGDAGPGEFITGFVPQPNVVNTSTFYVEVIDQSSSFAIPPNTYTDVVPINIYAVRSNGNLELQATRFFTLSFTIPRYAEVSIVPVNAPHDPTATTYVMNFGEMTPHQELEADLRIKANVPYGLWISSLNGGQLRKNPSTTSVPYQIRIGAGPYLTPTSSGQWVLNENSPSTSSGRPYRLNVRLGNFSSLDDGDYEEAITLTVQAY
jgi:hypothetical protein